MHRSLSIAVVVSSTLLIGSVRGAEFDTWAKAYDARSQSRFIPVELWTGAPWDGRQEIGRPPADLIFGKRDHKRIRGPIAWTRPGTSEALQVYERLNGSKRQLFALRSDNTGLGRVYDSRYSRNCIDAIKFPLGRWKEGEIRRYKISCNDGREIRPIVMIIQKIDFTYDGVPHSLQFRWIADGGIRPGTDVIYVYSPGLGLVNTEGE